MSRATVLEERHDGIVVLTMNRPQRRNAFNDQMYEDIYDALGAAQSDDSVRAVVITGAPGAFSAGMDFHEPGKGIGFVRFIDRLSSYDKPVIAAVNGVAVGVGLTMLPHCDLVFVAESARFRAPFVAIGLVPEAGSSLMLPMVMGGQRAAEALLAARWLTAADAVETGLARRVVPDGELMNVALEMAREIAAHPLEALRQTKRLIVAARRDAVNAACRREEQALMERKQSPEHQEAIRAFKSRR